MSKIVENLFVKYLKMTETKKVLQLLTSWIIADRANAHLQDIYKSSNPSSQLFKT